MDAKELPSPPEGLLKGGFVSSPLSEGTLSSKEGGTVLTDQGSADWPGYFICIPLALPFNTEP